MFLWSTEIGHNFPMRSVTSFNSAWCFRPGFTEESLVQRVTGESVMLPHTAVELPLNYFDESCYQREFTYQKVLPWDPAFADREVSLVFDGAMANATVWVNGSRVAFHPDGYTPFEARLAAFLTSGENLITVRIDGSENPAIPPFGGRIDYLTYAGLYRDVWLRVTPRVSIVRIKAESLDPLAAVKSLDVHCTVAGLVHPIREGHLSARLLDSDGRVLAEAAARVTSESVKVTLGELTGLRLWSIENPVLYQLSVSLDSAAGLDHVATPYGFRSARFTATGFYLNDRPVKLRGLNRHQSWPYAGYAMGRRAQERDAEILKTFLRCNIVRTSHYPQSPWFLDHCDRIGLLVFEEIPGWQHIGDARWKEEAVNNVRRMIERDWNHPSIVLWGVRINESADDHDLYVETNRLARQLDGTRQTGGVRCITHSELLEDVYTMNDFIQGQEETIGSNGPALALRDPAVVTGLPGPVPYLVTEYNGHMFPTKRRDQEQRQAEHVRRHLAVLNSARHHPGISGCIGWCMFDYNTHKDFGSGDRICHHGVLDAFREPKFAAYAYASQCDPAEAVVLKPVTYWARGERNIGGTLPLILLTNCDEVEMRCGPITKRVKPDTDTYPSLLHPPVVFDHRHFSEEELGSWGMEWHDVVFAGFVGGEERKIVRFVADPVPTTLEVVPDQTVLWAGERDSVRVLVRALDQARQLMPYLDDVIVIQAIGPIKVLGPTTLALDGGTAGFWLESMGERGNVSLTISANRFGSRTLEMTVVNRA